MIALNSISFAVLLQPRPNSRRFANGKSEPEEWSKICQTGNLEKGASNQIITITETSEIYF